MIETPRIFDRLADGLGTTVADVLAEIRAQTTKERFRSDLEPPSLAGMLQTSAERVRFACAMPYVAGYHRQGRLRVTAICVDARLRWYCDTNRTARLIVLGMGGRFPRTVLDAMVGMDAAAIVRHPLLEGAGCIVTKAHGNPTMLELAVDVDWIQVVGDEMERAA